MKFITVAPVLFTSTVFAAWTTTPALSAKVEASATINDKNAEIYAVDSKSLRSLSSSSCMDSPSDWYYHSKGEEHDCVWYSEGTRCEQYGDTHANRGKTANEACCTCGGGYFAFTSRDELQEAVDEYCDDPVAWENNEKSNTYGPIESWDVSKILDMKYLFMFKTDCNPDIGNWNVGKVTSFDFMFSLASSFNQDIGGWDVSSGVSFSGMFSSVDSFNQDIGGWDVSSGIDFQNMFSGATSFNQDIGGWDVSGGTRFESMFELALSFNQDISGWDVSSGTDFGHMFWGAYTFDQDLCKWQMKSDAMKNYFCSGPVSCGDCTISVM